MKQEVLDGVVRNDQVNPAVVIDVNRRNRQRLSYRPTGRRIADLDTRSCGNIGEMPIPVVMVKIRKDTFKIARRAVRTTDIGQLERSGQIQLGRPTNVIADE